MSQNLQDGDIIKFSDFNLVVEEYQSLGYVHYDVELTTHLLISPSKKVLIGLPRDLPIEVFRIN